VQAGLTAQKLAALTDYSRKLTFNVATISGGTVLNRVPHEAVIEGEFRAFTDEVFADARKNFLALSGPGRFAARLMVSRVRSKRRFVREPRVA